MNFRFGAQLKENGIAMGKPHGKTMVRDNETQEMTFSGSL
jgi:hypothetical protein